MNKMKVYIVVEDYCDFTDHYGFLGHFCGVYASRSGALNKVKKLVSICKQEIGRVNVCEHTNGIKVSGVDKTGKELLFHDFWITPCDIRRYDN